VEDMPVSNLKEQIRAHKEDLKALQDTDPQFFEFLKTQDSELLNFDDGDFGSVSTLFSTNNHSTQQQPTTHEISNIPSLLALLCILFSFLSFFIPLFSFSFLLNFHYNSFLQADILKKSEKTKKRKKVVEEDEEQEGEGEDEDEEEEKVQKHVESLTMEKLDDIISGVNAVCVKFIVNCP
jgi:CO dehydrogenase/acetyl-CoA synthase beta subunit